MAKAKTESKQVTFITNVKFHDIEANKTRNVKEQFTVSAERAKELAKAKDKKNRQLVTVVEIKK